MTDLNPERVRKALEAAEPYCIKCGNKLSEHHHRHPFQPSHTTTIEYMAPDLAAAYLAQAQEIERLREALRRHHDWHLSQDRDGAAWGIDPVDAYSESGLCEETVAALAVYRATEERG